MIDALTDVFAEGATGFLYPCLRTGKFSWRKICVVSPLSFVYLFCIKINCTVFLEIEMVHVKRTVCKNTIWEAAGASVDKKGEIEMTEF